VLSLEEEQGTKWIGPSAHHCWEVPSMAKSDYRNLAVLLVAVTPPNQFVVVIIKI